MGSKIIQCHGASIRGAFIATRPLRARQSIYPTYSGCAG